MTAADPRPIGETLLKDPRVRKLTFTGSTDVGKMLAREASHDLKRVSLELGGHAPFTVCRDADPVHAAKGLSLVKFLNTGQAYISPNRIFVHVSQMDPFLDELRSRVAGLKAGSGFDAGVRIGPLVNAAALKKVDRQVRDTVDKGAGLVAGGHRLTEGGLDRGFFYAPTILTDVAPDMVIYREETFGPVAPIIPLHRNSLFVNENTTRFSNVLRPLASLHGYNILWIRGTRADGKAAWHRGMVRDRKKN